MCSKVFMVQSSEGRPSLKRCRCSCSTKEKPLSSPGVPAQCWMDVCLLVLNNEVLGLFGVSIGLVAINEASEKITALLSAADTACYMAKEQGRNRVHVHHEDDNEIGQLMGKQTIAEFVESEAILEKLREIGVDYAQGYGIGRPEPLEQLVEPIATP